MVEIRQLGGIRKLRLPTKPEQQRVERRQVKVVVRRRRDFPPPTPQPTPCVLWQGSVDRQGYGRMKVSDQSRPSGWRTAKTHRYFFEMAIGRRLRPDEILLHACDNPPCFRFEHLSIGTIQDNNADMKAKGRNVAPPKNVFNRSNHPNTKLTNYDVEQITKMRKEGWTVQALATHYHVSLSTIYNITRREGVSNDDQRRAKPGSRKIDQSYSHLFGVDESEDAHGPDGTVRGDGNGDAGSVPQRDA